ncbi:unannotated protein [freshwater metagenome]|uniref:Unannotated protein n=1 Tax=freshwater metagenome TaxID=449393 RepID=A0A6J6TCC6_9ZZZZ|nr:glycosyltransferase [Actinomycetota bacterium]
MRVLRVVTLASSSGAYGGPYDTACRQVVLGNAVDGCQARLVAGRLSHDEVALPEGVPGALTPVSPLLPGLGVSGLVSVKLVRLLWRETHDSATIVHVSFARELVPLVAALIALIRRRPLVCQPHGMLTSRTSPAHRVFDRLVVRPLVRRSSIVVCLTSSERARLIAWLGHGSHSNMVVLGNPVLLSGRMWPPRRDGVHEIVWIARLAPRKRVRVFLEAASLDRAADADRRYLVIGPDGGDLPRVLLCDEVEYLGAVAADEVEGCLSRADVFVLTSQDEPWGNVLALALAMGKVAIVPESAALASSLREAEAAIVIPDDDAKALQAAIASVSVDREAAASMSRSAKLYAESNFASEAQKLNLQRIWQKSLTSQQRNGG